MARRTRSAPRHAASCGATQHIYTAITSTGHGLREYTFSPSLASEMSKFGLQVVGSTERRSTDSAASPPDTEHVSRHSAMYESAGSQRATPDRAGTRSSASHSRDSDAWRYSTPVKKRAQRPVSASTAPAAHASDAADIGIYPLSAPPLRASSADAAAARNTAQRGLQSAHSYSPEPAGTQTPVLLGRSTNRVGSGARHRPSSVESRQSSGASAPSASTAMARMLRGSLVVTPELTQRAEFQQAYGPAMSCTGPGSARPLLQSETHAVPAHGFSATLRNSESARYAAPASHPASLRTARAPNADSSGRYAPEAATHRFAPAAAPQPARHALGLFRLSAISEAAGDARSSRSGSGSSVCERAAAMLDQCAFATTARGNYMPLASRMQRESALSRASAILRGGIMTVPASRSGDHRAATRSVRASSASGRSVSSACSAREWAQGLLQEAAESEAALRHNSATLSVAQQAPRGSSAQAGCGVRESSASEAFGKLFCTPLQPPAEPLSAAPSVVGPQTPELCGPAARACSLAERGRVGASASARVRFGLVAQEPARAAPAYETDPSMRSGTSLQRLACSAHQHDDAQVMSRTHTLLEPSAAPHASRGQRERQHVHAESSKLRAGARGLSACLSPSQSLSESGSSSLDLRLEPLF